MGTAHAGGCDGAVGIRGAAGIERADWPSGPLRVANGERRSSAKAEDGDSGFGACRSTCANPRARHDLHMDAEAASYFGRVSKERIIEAVREGVSAEAAGNIAGMKKQAMAEAAEQRLAGTGWLPQLLRTTGPTSEPAAERAA